MPADIRRPDTPTIIPTINPVFLLSWPLEYGESSKNNPTELPTIGYPRLLLFIKLLAQFPTALAFELSDGEAAKPAISDPLKIYEITIVAVIFCQRILIIS